MYDKFNRKFISTRKKAKSLAYLTMCWKPRYFTSLAHFQSATSAKHAFQAVVEMPHVDADCFERTRPTVVPARSLFSQFG